MTPRVFVDKPETTRDQMTIEVPGVVANIYNPIIWGKEAEKSGIQGQPRVHSKLQNSVGYIRPCLKKLQRKVGGMTNGKVIYKVKHSPDSDFPTLLCQGSGLPYCLWSLSHSPKWSSLLVSHPVPWLFHLFNPTWAPLLGSESPLYHPCQAPHPVHSKYLVTVNKLIQAPKQQTQWPTKRNYLS